MKTIYRIENGAGEGMYHTTGSRCFNFIDGVCDMENWEHHPEPTNDATLSEQICSRRLFSCYGDFGHWRFGFGSVDQLRKWVLKDEWLVQLHEWDFVLAICEVEDDLALIGSTQAIFERPSTYRKVSIKEFFNL